MARIGIRSEDKNRWEARTPLVPDDVRNLIRDHGTELTVQRSDIRAFAEEDYAAAGATLCDDLAGCPIVIGVKEIPAEKLSPNTTYLFFSHTIKGQSANMPLLRHLMKLKCQLIDYEPIADAQGRRLVFFGRFAGLAGMIDTLWALGQRWRHEGIDNPFANIRQAYRYATLDEAKADLTRAGEHIGQHGLPQRCRPFVCGFAGYGQVSSGAQELFDLLPVETVSPGDLACVERPGNTCIKVVFREEDMVERVDRSSPFELPEYYDHPHRARGRFRAHLEPPAALVHAIPWAPTVPRLVTRAMLGELFGGEDRPRLRVIADISCDVEGSVECTERVTEPDNPVYVYEPGTGLTRDGVEGDGPVMLAVDNLPCELPVDSSIYFSRSLSPLIPAIAKADYKAPLAQCGLPPELTRAMIVYQGELTEPYRYLAKFLTD